jgi:hypothetical protein
MCTVVIISYVFSYYYKDKYFRKNYKEIKYIFYVQKLFSENFVFYGIMRKNMVQPDRPQMTI